MASRCGPTFGLSQINVASILAIMPPRARTFSAAAARKIFEARPAIADRKAENGCRCRLPPGRREGVGDGVAQDVGVGMADKSMIMRDFHAAEPDMIAGPEGMDVIALSGPDIRKIADESRLRDGQIFGAGDFHVRAVSFENMDAMSRPIRRWRHRRSVRFSPAAAACRCAARMRSNRNACGVCTARSRARAGVADSRRRGVPADVVRRDGDGARVVDDALRRALLLVRGPAG